MIYCNKSFIFVIFAFVVLSTLSNISSLLWCVVWPDVDSEPVRKFHRGRRSILSGHSPPPTDFYLKLGYHFGLRVWRYRTSIFVLRVLVFPLICTYVKFKVPMFWLCTHGGMQLAFFCIFLHFRFWLKVSFFCILMQLRQRKR